MIGEAALGVWRDQAVDVRPHSSKKIIDIPVREHDKADDVRFSILVADTSVDRSLPKGWYAICAPLPDRHHDVQDFSVGDMLYIERTRRGLKEMSLRRVSAITGERMRLSAHSTDPKWRQDVTYPANSGNAGNGDKVRLVGRVVGKYADYLPD